MQIEELVKNIDVLNQHSINGEQLKAAFRAFDINNDGYIRSVLYGPHVMSPVRRL